MITEQDLQEAIAECKGQRNPNASTCIKLAAFLTIQRELFGQKEPEPDPVPGFSFSAGPANEAHIGYQGESEFSEIIRGKNPDDIWPIMDELMVTLQAINPRLYNAVIRQLTE